MKVYYNHVIKYAIQYYIAVPLFTIIATHPVCAVIMVFDTFYHLKTA